MFAPIIEEKTMIGCAPYHAARTGYTFPSAKDRESSYLLHAKRKDLLREPTQLGLVHWSCEAYILQSSPV